MTSSYRKLCVYEELKPKKADSEFDLLLNVHVLGYSIGIENVEID